MKMLRAALLAMVFAHTAIAQASPLRLDYVVNPVSGGLFNYEFSLVLDNNDGSWAAGQGWGWLVFGDAFQAPSPLTDFVGDVSRLPVGPWTAFTTSSGNHNGPTFWDVSSLWIPASIGETLRWSGTSSADLDQGVLLFSTLGTTAGATAAEFEIAKRLTPVPIPTPSGIALVSLGLAALAFSRRRTRI